MVRPEGSSWWKVDFHAHSPASFDFGGPEGAQSTESISVHDWLQAYMDAGVDVVVVTDHNTGAGIEPARVELEQMRTAAGSSFRDLTLLPGVELTVNDGYHLLAVFDVAADHVAIDRLLARCNYRGDQGGSNGTCENSLEQSIKEISSDGGIAIPAHIEKSGYLNLDMRSRQEIERAGLVVAVEATTESGVAYAQERGWASILGSDAHYLDAAGAPEGIEAKYPGSHFSWVKMQEPNLHGLKLALSDPESSVRTSIETTAHPNTTTKNVVRRVTVKRGDDEFEQEFSPWMNAVIGGRGVGKSTIVELLRLVMGRFGELPERLRTDQSWFSDQPAQAGQPRYWDIATTITVDYEKLGQSFRVVWSGDTRDADVYVWVDGEWRPDAGTPRERFPILMYSQKQIYETAQDPQILLRMIDQRPDINFADWESDFKQLKAEYRTARSEILEMDATILAETRLRGELADLTTEIVALGAKINSPHLAEMNDLLAAEASDEEVEDIAVALQDDLEKVLANFESQVEAIPVDESETEEAPSIPEWEPFVTRRTALRESLASIESTVDLLRSSRETFRAEDYELSPRAVRIAALRAALGGGESDDEDDPATKHQELSERKAEVTRSLANIEVAKERRTRLISDAEALLARVRTHRDQLTSRRKAFVASISKPDLKLDIFALGDEELLESDLRRLLSTSTGFDAVFAKGSGLRTSLPHPQSNDYPAAIDKLKAAIEDLHRSGADSPLLTSGQIGTIERRFFSRLSTIDADDLKTELDLWFPEDRLQLKYSQDGGALRNLEQGSPGQKTAALLTVILQLSEDPLILDQPEDDLDNKLISDLVVKALRRNKVQRQVIVVTHNANVVVNGDAELVVVMKGNLPVPATEAVGTIQDTSVKDAICLILEGGEPAFAARYKRLIAAGVHL